MAKSGGLSSPRELGKTRDQSGARLRLVLRQNPSPLLILFLQGVVRNIYQDQAPEKLENVDFLLRQVKNATEVFARETNARSVS